MFLKKIKNLFTKKNSESNTFNYVNYMNNYINDLSNVKARLRKVIPIIGATSSGKSYFVDSLLGLNLYENHINITTKFVCIIQHHKELKEPRFYQIHLAKRNINMNSNIMEYEATRIGDVIVGFTKIKEKIKEINYSQKNVEFDKIKYEELFYVLEIKMKNIKNEKLLYDYDFYDIPGLDVYLGEKTEDMNNEEQRLKYIENLFKYFKSRIDFGVFIINAESYEAKAQKQVILNVAKYLAPKKIQNYLIVLNKIDRKSEPNITIMKVKSLIVNNLLDDLNLADNIFIPLDSRQLRHQNLMKTNFENFFTFLFNQYVNKSVIPFKDNRKGNDFEEKYNTNIYPFSRFLYDFIVEELSQNEIENYLDNLEIAFDKKYNINELKFN